MTLLNEYYDGAIRAALVIVRGISDYAVRSAAQIGPEDEVDRLRRLWDLRCTS